MRTFNIRGFEIKITEEVSQESSVVESYEFNSYAYDYLSGASILCSICIWNTTEGLSPSKPYGCKYEGADLVSESYFPISGGFSIYCHRRDYTAFRSIEANLSFLEARRATLKKLKIGEF